MNDELIRAARTAMKQAYAPYSRFRVGAALETKGGNIHTGCNVENASYGLTLCAERNAIAAAVVAGEREFVRVAIVTSGRKPTPPCGACRQALREFGSGIQVLMAGGKEVKRMSLEKLLPNAFHP